MWNDAGGRLFGVGLMSRPMPGFRPGGRLTFLGAQESKQRNLPCKTAPAGFPAMLERRGPRRTRFVRCAHCAQTATRSQSLKRAAHAPRRSALLGGLEGEIPKQPSSQEPNASAGRRRLFLHSPFEPAEERRTSSPFAKRTSTSGSRRLSEQSVAARVRRAGLKSEHHRAARCEAEGRAVRGRLFAYFLVAQKVGRPPGRIPGISLATDPK